MEDFDKIIQHYLQDFQTITKEESNHIKNNLCYNQQDNSNTLGLKHFKIVDNKLYSCTLFVKGWESRIEAFKYMMLCTLEKYKINDCEFFMYDDDGINDRNINKCIYNNKLLPIIVTTSVLYKYNMILCPDFTFSFCPEYFIKNNERMCKKIVEAQENVNFNNKIDKIVWRGSGNPPYRAQYLRTDADYDIMSVINQTTFPGQKGPALQNKNGLSREQKANYKYHLHLNGHNGNNVDGAYSSAFKWSLMTKSVVFYSAPSRYREFWDHPLIFRDNEHFVYSTNPNQLYHQLITLKQNPVISEKIAYASFNFFKKYLMNYDNILYYMNKLLSEYEKRMNYKVELTPDDVLITGIEHNDYIFSDTE